jgi:hypothetical protein
MDVQTLSLPRFLSKTRHPTNRQQERVEGVYMQEQFFGPTLSGPSRKGNDLPTEIILAEHICTACNESAAATTLFIP